MTKSASSLRIVTGLGELAKPPVSSIAVLFSD